MKVLSAHAEIDLADDAAAGRGGRRDGADRIGGGPELRRRLAVERLGHRIEHAPEPAHMRINDGVLVGRQRLAAEADAFERAESHEQRAAFAKADDLARNLAAIAGQ